MEFTESRLAWNAKYILCVVEVQCKFLLDEATPSEVRTSWSTEGNITY